MGEGRATGLRKDGFYGGPAGSGAGKVSVIIPTYNRAPYLSEAIVSVLGQKYGDVEIIVVDDGSTDNTRECLQRYIDEGRITYLHQENSGRPAVARNLGLRHASGEYVCFLDSDDILMEESIVKGVEILGRHDNIAMVCSDWLYFRKHFTENQELEPSWIRSTGYLDRLPKEMIRDRGGDFVVFERDFMYELFNSNFICTSNVITRKELLDRTGYFDESLKIGEDYDLWLRLLETKDLAYIMVPLVFRRRHDGSITRHLAQNLIEDAKVIEKFMGKKRVMSPATRRRLYRRLEAFYFYTGYFFMDERNLPESRKRFGKAIRYNPASYRNYRYFTISLLPASAILFARKLKRLMRGARRR